MNIQRNLEAKIKQALQQSASVVLIGPRQIGKTTAASHGERTRGLVVPRRRRSRCFVGIGALA